MTIRTAEDKGTKRNPDFMTVAHKLQALFDQVRKSLDDAGTLCYVYTLRDSKH
jgi:hypothetical protein